MWSRTETAYIASHLFVTDTSFVDDSNGAERIDLRRRFYRLGFSISAANGFRTESPCHRLGSDWLHRRRSDIYSPSSNNLHDFPWLGPAVATFGQLLGGVDPITYTSNEFSIFRTVV